MDLKVFGNPGTHNTFQENNIDRVENLCINNSKIEKHNTTNIHIHLHLYINIDVAALFR